MSATSSGRSSSCRRASSRGVATQPAATARRCCSRSSRVRATAVFVKDLEGRYLLVNDAARRCSPCPRDMVLGRTDPELFDADEAAVAARPRRRRARRRRGAPLLAHRTDWGVQRTLSIVKTPHRDASGNDHRPDRRGARRDGHAAPGGGDGPLLRPRARHALHRRRRRAAGARKRGLDRGPRLDAPTSCAARSAARLRAPGGPRPGASGDRADALGRHRRLRPTALPRAPAAGATSSGPRASRPADDASTPSRATSPIATDAGRARRRARPATARWCTASRTPPCSRSTTTCATRLPPARRSPPPGSRRTWSAARSPRCSRSSRRR